MNRAFAEATCYGVQECAPLIGPDWIMFAAGLLFGVVFAVVLGVGKRGAR